MLRVVTALAEDFAITHLVFATVLMDITELNANTKPYWVKRG